MRTVQFQGCVVRIWDDTQHVSILFPDGATAEACPNHRDEDKARAVSLGYGEDLWAMTVDHELGHCILAEMDGLPHSPILWHVAHGTVDQLPQDHWKEEARVLEMQRFHRRLAAS